MTDNHETIERAFVQVRSPSGIEYRVPARVVPDETAALRVVWDDTDFPPGYQVLYVMTESEWNKGTVVEPFPYPEPPTAPDARLEDGGRSAAPRPP